MRATAAVGTAVAAPRPQLPSSVGKRTVPALVVGTWRRERERVTTLSPEELAQLQHECCGGGGCCCGEHGGDTALGD